MDSHDIDLLVDAARAGGGWAFGRLWEQLSPAVQAYLRHRGCPDPEDTTSEVFLAAFRQIERFVGDGSGFRAWLFTIAHHKAVDQLRRGAHRHESPRDVVDDGRTASSAEDSVLASLGDSEVARLLAMLTADQRGVLLLRVIGELSLEETAAAVGKPVGAVKQLQHRGLATLRRKLSAEPVTPDASAAIARLR